MGTSVAEFLDRWDGGRRPDLPETTSGTLRLDAAEDGHTAHWRLTIRDQRVEVTRSADDADLVVRADREVFDRLASGRTHLATALLRNDLSVRGNMRLLMMLRRIFPGPSDARHPREVARERDGHR
ncbi:SCP2 sterol-binding domain-containing protein [Micromonospora sp. WMMD708]|uniref:SCP2 sterol-binding domain-containing protein n=1 Tax=Micromonospora sp. WMMD708 TaxID=3403464 RepID=UPI003BF54D23